MFEREGKMCKNTGERGDTINARIKPTKNQARTLKSNGKNKIMDTQELLIVSRGTVDVPNIPMRTTVTSQTRSVRLI